MSLQGTYLGGSLNDSPAAIAVDSGGNAYIVGTANSSNFPVTTGAYQPMPKGNGDAFLTELNAQGSALVYSTFLGGSSSDSATAIAVDALGNVYIAGSTQSTDFPTTAGAFSTSKTSQFQTSIFLTKVNAGGASLAYSSYLGGTSSDTAAGVAIDSSKNAYVLGTTNSSDFPTTPGAVKTQRSTIGCCFNDSEVVISKFNPMGTSLIYSTYLGTASSEIAGGIAIDGNNGVYVAGKTQSLAYPTTAGAFQLNSKATGSNYTGFVTKIDFSSATVCNVVLASNSISLPGRGGAGSVGFTVANGCPWEITSDSFITVGSVHSGFGNGTVSFTVQQNQSTFSTVTGTIRVNGGVLNAGSNIFTVNQAMGSCSDPVFGTSTVNFGQAGGIQNVSISLPSNCQWGLAGVPAWVTASNTVNSSGPGNLQLYAAPNSYSARLGSMTLAGKTISLTQTGGSCVLSLATTLSGVPATATAGSVGFTTAAGCTWAAYSTVPWIQVGANSVTGQGNGTVTFVAASNPGSAGRAGSLLIGDQTYYVTQAGGPGVIPLSYTSALFTSSSNGFGGDGGPVGAASVFSPAQMVFDRAGNLYFADTFNQRIRKVDTNGIITTFAGGGASALGDGGPPTTATLANARGVAVDASGIVYIADTGNNRIRKVSNNVITTIAGNGTANYSGDNGLATGATISAPNGIVVDASGNIYFTDTGNQRIRKIDTTGVITTIAGTGVVGFGGDGGNATSALLGNPGSLAIDAAGNLYFVDQQNYRVRKISPAGIITTVAGNGTGSTSSGDGGPATSAAVFTVSGSGLTVDSSGSIYVGECCGGIRKVTPDGIIHTINLGIGYTAGGMVVDTSGNLYASPYVAIYKLTPVQTFCTYTVSQPPAESTAGGTFSLAVTATTSSCSWSAWSSVPWITVQTPNGS